MKRINSWFRAVFGFNQKEINGFIILSIFMVLLLAAPFFYTLIFPSVSYDSTDDERILQELVVQASKKKEVKIEEKKKSKWIPNKYKKDTKEGSIQKRKYHVIKSDNEQSDHVKPEWVKKKYVKKVILPIEINTGDTIAFKQIRGIGSKLSQRIITYRERLGGFHSINQLTEVYGVDSILISENLKYFVKPNLDSIKILDLNTATVKELVHHPYISYKQAIAIANYRDQHGEYNSIEDILKIHIIKEEDIEKLKYYLLFK